jgi:hypothetical protein
MSAIAAGNVNTTWKYPTGRSSASTYPTTLGRKPIAATLTIQPQQARTHGKIPIAPAAPPPHMSRDFVPWRFLDAGRKSAWKRSSCRRPKTCTIGDIACRRDLQLMRRSNPAGH